MDQNQANLEKENNREIIKIQFDCNSEFNELTNEFNEFNEHLMTLNGQNSLLSKNLNDITCKKFINFRLFFVFLVKHGTVIPSIISKSFFRSKIRQIFVEF